LHDGGGLNVSPYAEENAIRIHCRLSLEAEGNGDLVGNNIPVFFLRDSLKFPDVDPVIKRDPRTNFRSAHRNWDLGSPIEAIRHTTALIKA
jgi:catalase